MNKAPNFVLFSFLLFYFVLDSIFKYTFNNKYNCGLEISEIFLNIIIGGSLAAGIVVLMIANGSSKFLFFNEVQSSREQCSQPTKQTFKCDVYKDGQLVQSI
jgi:hypothetical protein